MNNVLYFHINLVKNEVFYVGIGNNKRPKSKKNRNKHWHNIVNKYDYDILVEETDLTWDQACELERYWIKRIGRKDLSEGPLVNMTDGGEGTIGHVHSSETRIKMSKTRSGVKFSEDHKLKLSISKMGTKVSEDTKLKISQTTKGKFKTEEHKLNISLGSIGKPATKGNTGKKRSVETNLKINAAKQLNRQLKLNNLTK